MQYTKLGNTDIEVCKICIGGMSFGDILKVDILLMMDGRMSEVVLAWLYAKRTTTLMMPLGQ